MARHSPSTRPQPDATSGAIRLSFLGAAGTVTGSKYLIEGLGARVLIDCGLFQGLKPLRERNWAPFPVAPSAIDAVVLTHAHLDHSGYLPLLARHGFRGPVHCTHATHDLCGILLPDSGFLQERDAEFANRHGFSRHRPAQALYTEADAVSSLRLFRPQRPGTEVSVAPGIRARFLPAGHILGASIVELTLGSTTIVFSGDLGRPDDPLLPRPALVERADYLVVESTYGDRRHGSVSAARALSDIINRTVPRGGSVLIPSFAVGRAQAILHCLQQLKQGRHIPDLPVFLDSPMAVDASDIFCRHMGEHRLTPEQCRALCATARYVNDVQESKALGHDPMPKVIIAASGMATGGRVLHHLKVMGPDPRNALVLAGYQAAGTRGAAIVAGAQAVKIHGAMIPIRAAVHMLDMLSAHADQDEILTWLRGFSTPPRRTFITHGEAHAAAAMEGAIERYFGWPCHVPMDGETVDLEEAAG